MSHSRNKKIYFINRYDLWKVRKKRKYSGYEQIIKYHSGFKTVYVNEFVSKVFSKCIRSYPKHYIPLNFVKELVLIVKGLITRHPIFYLYADKDAFFIPRMKRRFKLKRLKLYGTLHWPIAESGEFSFYRHNLSDQFNGIIGLSNAILELKHPNTRIINHGIDLDYWSRDTTMAVQNQYLLVGISNRDHSKQADIIRQISELDKEARFIILCRDASFKRFYSEHSNLTFIVDFIEDSQLKELYNTSKAVILFQNYCLASNVVLEAMAMSVPLITNNVGDISEYLGKEYPLYIDPGSEASKLKDICFSNEFQEMVQGYLNSRRIQFGWNSVVKETIEFIA